MKWIKYLSYSSFLSKLELFFFTSLSCSSCFMNSCFSSVSCSVCSDTTMQTQWRWKRGKFLRNNQLQLDSALCWSGLTSKSLHLGHLGCDVSLQFHLLQKEKINIYPGVMKGVTFWQQELVQTKSFEGRNPQDSRS